MQPDIQFKAIDLIDEIGKDDCIATESDSICLALLFVNGITIAERPGFDTGVALFETPTHHVMVNRSYGFADTKENGYVALLLAKTKAAREDAAALFEDILSTVRNYHHATPKQN